MSSQPERSLKLQSKSIPKSGQSAPDFEATKDTGDTFRLSGQRPSWVILFFYPKDDTSG